VLDFGSLRGSPLELPLHAKLQGFAIYCGKSEGGLSLPHEKPGASAWLRPATPALLQSARREAPRKKFSGFVPYNPLKSLDSDERIQGNPKKSNALNRGFQSETGSIQDNPNGDDPRQRRTGGTAAVRPRALV
jgi:hypothetical protein